MKQPRKEGKKPKIRYSKVMVNIPEQLIARFDRICQREGFSRQEAIKQAMRDFIYEYTDENDADPAEIRDTFKSMFLGMAEAAKEFPAPQQTLTSSKDGRKELSAH